ncbi:hypothetical protein NM688_g4995 [Phlebia brevispora]|uniref:Uncharacterized protein n=1 Tax=Phlebia brevispora TaxID=194682 RepID=A0ACC1T1C9_9APHY|nr:hypothetical protein NM688_g4995 [Phlebia brevispora]
MLFDKTLGVLHIGNTLNATLYGMATVQVYMYFQKYSNRDHIALRTLIFIMWIFNTVGMGLYLETTYFYGVKNFLNPEALFYPPWSILADWTVGLLGDCIVTGIYASRVWRLIDRVTFRWAVVVVIATMTTISLGTGLAFLGVALGNTYIEFGTRFPWLWYGTFGSQLIADLIITTFLCISLRRRRTGVRRTDSLLTVLILYTVNTCALTSLTRIASILAYKFGQETFIFVMVSSMLPRIIFSSLLALLNSRRSKQTKITDNLLSIHLSQLPSDHSNSTATPTGTGSDGDGVNVEKAIERTYDPPSHKYENAV